MIKRIRFATAGPSVVDFTAAWRSAVGAAAAAPPDVRPARVAVCTVLPDVTPAARHAGVGLEWFRDPAHLAGYERWRAASGADEPTGELGRVIDLAGSPVVVAEEHALRGADWLDRRWEEGGSRLKHMAVAVRREGLSPAEFAELWRSRAGRVGAVPIPAEARGCAYVQNHPMPRPGADWAYDAVNEVYLEDRAGLLTRVRWFEETMREGGEDDLVGENWFLAVEEDVLPL